MVKKEEAEKLHRLLGYLSDLLQRYNFVKEGEFTFMNPVTMEEEVESVEPNEERKFELEAKALLDEIKDTLTAIDWTKLE